MRILLDTWIASIGWGCDRAGLRGGGGFIVVFWAYGVVDFGPFFLGLFGFWWWVANFF